MSSKINAPSWISRADMLECLWISSKPARFFKTRPDGVALCNQQELDAWQSKAKVEKTLQKHPYVDYFGERCIKTNMAKYPELDLASYRKDCEIAAPIEEIFKKCLEHTRNKDLHP